MTDSESGSNDPSGRYESALRSIDENRAAVQRTQAGAQRHLDETADQLDRDRMAVQASRDRLERSSEANQPPDASEEGAT
jgi:hypothetical protein